MKYRLAIISAIGLTSATQAQESISPGVLADTFAEVCGEVFKDRHNEIASLLSADWKELPGGHEEERYTFRMLISHDHSTKATIQFYNFGKGSFEQCSIDAYSHIERSDIPTIMGRYPAATGKLLENSDGSYSGIWLLTDQPAFTSLNIIFNDTSASMISMRTTYTAPQTTTP